MKNMQFWTCVVHNSKSILCWSNNTLHEYLSTLFLHVFFMLFLVQQGFIQNILSLVFQPCAGDDVTFLCIVRDLVDPEANAIKHTMNLQGSKSVRSLINDICKQFGYMLNTISVHYEKQEGEDVIEVGNSFRTHWFVQVFILVYINL